MTAVRDSKFSPCTGIVHIRIKPGADLLAGIQEGLQKHGITSGVFLSGLGALKKAVFRNLRVFPASYPVQAQDRLYFEVEKPIELLAINGWIAERPDGGAEVHAHITASYVEGDKVVAVGGHLMTGVIAAIKVVVAVGILPPGSLPMSFDAESQSLDIDLS